MAKTNSKNNKKQELKKGVSGDGFYGVDIIRGEIASVEDLAFEIMLMRLP